MVALLAKSIFKAAFRSLVFNLHNFVLYSVGGTL